MILDKTITCAVEYDAHIDVEIDSLTILGPDGPPGLRTADFLIMGNQNTTTNVRLKNINANYSGGVKECENPPSVIFFITLHRRAFFSLLHKILITLSFCLHVNLTSEAGLI